MAESAEEFEEVEKRDSDAWIAEVERRAQAALSGVAGLTWEETRAYIEACLPHK